MKAKITILVALVAAIVGYWAYNNFFRGSAAEDEKNVRASFNAMSLAIASQNEAIIKNLLAPTFSDSAISEENFLKVLTIKRPVYNTTIKSIVTQGDLASLIYSRTEARAEGQEPVTAQIIGETWERDKKNRAIWKLQKLAPNDKWFRKLELETKQKAATTKEKVKKPVLGTLEAKAATTSMQIGEKYTPTGKRDPFKSLVAVEDGAGEEGREVCDPDRPRELLESYDLMSLKLAGVITRSGETPVALVEAPDGKGYTVFQGMYLGKRCGKVIDIQSDHLVILEQVRKPGARTNGFESVETPLKLRPEEG